MNFQIAKKRSKNVINSFLYRAGPGPTVLQVDLAPSIAWLLNAPLPGDSTGRVLPSLMPNDIRQNLYLLHVMATHNAKETSMPTDTGIQTVSRAIWLEILVDVRT